MLALGVVAGFFSGFLGVGGGIVMVPLLVGWLRFDQHRAHATSLAAIVLIAISATVRFSLAGEVDWGIGVALAAGGMVGSTVGAQWMHRLQSESLKMVFGLILVGAGVSMVFGATPDVGEAASGLTSVLVGVGIGLFAGVASGLAGIGGGVVMVPAMVFLMGVSQHTAEGTSLVAILFTALAGTRVNVRNRRVSLRDAVLVGMGGVLLAPLGATAALQVSALSLSRVFGIFVVLVGIRMVWLSRNRAREWG